MAALTQQDDAVNVRMKRVSVLRVLLTYYNSWFRLLNVTEGYKEKLCITSFNYTPYYGALFAWSVLKGADLQAYDFTGVPKAYEGTSTVCCSDI